MAKKFKRRKKEKASLRGAILYALAGTLILHGIQSPYMHWTSGIQNTIRSKTTEWKLESTCKAHLVWYKDIFWRESALEPTVCDPTDDLEKETLAESRLGIEHLRDSVHLRNPCGSYCVFHTDSLATRRRVPVTGWALKSLSNNGTIGCWKPIYHMEVDSCFRWFDSWTHWVEDNNRGVPEPPCPECDAARPAAIELISKNVGRRCQGDSTGSWEKNSFWRNSVEDPVLCKKPGSPKSRESLNLGEQDLLESLATSTPCGSLCVFHNQSLPGKGVVGSDEATVTTRGWALVDTDKRNIKGCFQPSKDISISTCKAWSESWALRMPKTEVGASSASTECPRCDQLELPFGRYYWDHHLSKAAHVPPNELVTICGPRILIVGAMKCGTNTLGALLLKHPRVKINGCADYASPLCNMDHFTGDSSTRPQKAWEMDGVSHTFVADPINWKGKYAQRLPQTDGFNGMGELTFDKSPDYFKTEMFPGIATRAKQLLPNAKVVISLCNPVGRLFSEFMHDHHDKFGGNKLFNVLFDAYGVPAPSNFSGLVEMLKPESHICKSHSVLCEEVRRAKLHTGEYHVSLKKWKNEFGPENVLVLNMDESNSMKAKKMMKLAGDCLPDEEYPWSTLNEMPMSFENKEYGGRSVGYYEHADAMRWLHEYYQAHNQALSEEIDADWPLMWNTIPSTA